MMNENEIGRISAAVNALRPDWPTSSVRTLIETKLKTRTRRDVAVALTWVACDSTTKTPARVLEAGPWWNATNAEGGGRGERIPWQEQCHICSFSELRCMGPGNGDHEFMSKHEAEFHRRAALGIPAPDDVRGGPSPSREALAEARKRLCSHGIPREVCKSKHDDEEAA